MLEVGGYEIKFIFFLNLLSPTISNINIFCRERGRIFCQGEKHRNHRLLRKRKKRRVPLPASEAEENKS